MSMPWTFDAQRGGCGSSDFARRVRRCCATSTTCSTPGRLPARCRAHGSQRQWGARRETSRVARCAGRNVGDGVVLDGRPSSNDSAQRSELRVSAAASLADAFLPSRNASKRSIPRWTSWSTWVRPMRWRRRPSTRCTRARRRFADVTYMRRPVDAVLLADEPGHSRATRSLWWFPVATRRRRPACAHCPTPGSSRCARRRHRAVVTPSAGSRPQGSCSASSRSPVPASPRHARGGGGGVMRDAGIVYSTPRRQRTTASRWIAVSTRGQVGPVPDRRAAQRSGACR